MAFSNITPCCAMRSRCGVVGRNIAIGSHVVSAQRVHDDDQHIGRVRIQAEATGRSPFFPAATGYPEFPQIPVPIATAIQGETLLQNCKNAVSRLTAPASKRHAGAQREQKAGAMKEPACQCQPVIDAQKGQQEDSHPGPSKGAAQNGGQNPLRGANQGDRQKENGIDDW